MSEIVKLPLEQEPVVETGQLITIDKLKAFMPKGCSAKVTEEVLAMINNIENDTGLSQEYAEERIMSSMYMLGKKGASIATLVNAIKYACLKKHYTNEKAWAITFPEKYKKLTDEGRFVASHVSEYNGSDMVVEVEKSMLVPAYVTYQPYFHAAVQKQYDLMNGVGANEEDRVSPHVQHLAAKELAELTKMPEENNINLKIGMDNESKSVYVEMNAQLAMIAKQQRIGLESGKNIFDVQKLNINMDDILDAQLVEG